MAVLITRRLILLPFQVLGVLTIVFVLVHLLPGDPAYLIAGPQATAAQVNKIRETIGLNQPLPVQYVHYVGNIVRGDLGASWYTGNAVTTDIGQRAPATLEIITLALLGIIVLGVVIAGLIALNPGGIGGRIIAAYGFVAGALPDFWVGLALIFLIYYKARLGAAPSGQLSSHYAIPSRTGIATIDALLVGDGGAFVDAAKHLILPVATLIFVYMGPVVRVTGSAAVRSLQSEFVEYAESWGIAPWRRIYYALRHVMPVFVISVASTYGYLLGGAVLVETVFSWGGFGQYAVQSVTHSDYAAIEGFVIVAGVFTVLVYTVSDVLQMALDPRARR
jgi:ABC-type dipeptide/oligopeptide/nickel transport system permease component